MIKFNMGTILDWDQMDAIEKEFNAKSTESGCKSHYEYMQSIFMEFVKDKSVLEKYMKAKVEYRNKAQLYVIMAFAGMIVGFFQSSLFKPKKNDNTQDTEMEEYIKEHYRLIPYNDMLASSSQPSFFEYLNWIIRESDQLEEGIFTEGDDSGDGSKRFEVVADLNFLINFINTFYFE